MHYSLISVIGNGENEIDDQQTSDAILSINYRDNGNFKFAANSILHTSVTRSSNLSIKASTLSSVLNPLIFFIISNIFSHFVLEYFSDIISNTLFTFLFSPTFSIKDLFMYSFIVSFFSKLSNKFT